MGPVVSDAGPLNYLILIDAVECLPKQFGRVLIPEAVAMELSHPATPSDVRAWLGAAPPWLERRPDPDVFGVSVARRGAGERAAIALAQSVDVPLLLIDDRAGKARARALGLETIGTVGILARAAQLGLTDLRVAFTRLRATNFRYREDLLADLLTQHEARRP